MMDPNESEADYAAEQQIGEDDPTHCDGCGFPLTIDDPDDGLCASCSAEMDRAAACGEAPELPL